ncbi:helix-turn-helix domain-containing protein [Avibacterium avium]|uniref:helix-turn-helix domain-containing protein n=1 Tax=Avibacterium avium TaxID=751 RepID=UPI003BF80907
MNIKPIKTEQDYQQALAKIEPFFDKDILSEEETSYFEIMLTLIEKYEAEHYPIDLTDFIRTKG